MKLQMFSVDAFTESPFRGNPAAVVLLTQPQDDATLQKVATELNLSETSYVRLLEGDESAPWTTGCRYSLRWFTPVQEVLLCGHATIATAHVLFSELGNPSSQLEFETLSGVLVVRKEGSNIVMDFPSNPPVSLTPEQEKQLAPLVQVASGGLRLHTVLISHTLKYLLVCLHHSYSRRELEAIEPNFNDMKTAHDGSLAHCVMVCVAGDANHQHHAYSRFFAPLYGINEDPVTGSAHTVLAPYWAGQLGRKELNFWQCSERGGEVKVKILDNERVHVQGIQA
ncbi:phenazine biosynthesis-like domain-containing protein isoform X2 [Cherax quadricarinatus]|uniref:phenazine biosynthesis-like domain-containing protein isoform X2 n=1 Tax=Cherax quadricarinatus TaxID=27406 RepID=UPI00387E86E1